MCLKITQHTFHTIHSLIHYNYLYDFFFYIPNYICDKFIEFEHFMDSGRVDTADKEHTYQCIAVQ